MNFFTSLLLLAAGVFLVYLVYIILFQFSYWKLRKIPHIESLPLIGSNAPIVFRTASFAEYSQNLYKNFPEARYYGLFNFKKSAIVMKDPDLIRDINIKEFDSFMDHDTFVSEEMDPIVGRNIFSLRGQRWKDVRSTLSPSFTASRMKILFELIANCSENFVQYFIENPEVATKFDAKEAYARYTTDVIATSAFGVEINSMKDRENEFFVHGQGVVKFGSLAFAKIMLMRLFPTFMRSVDATFLPKSTDRFFKQVIRDNVKLRKDKGIVRPDMIQLLMQAMDKKELTVEDIVGQAVIFFIAGFETTAGLMTFITLELANNPHIQEKLVKEITDQLNKNDGHITYDSLSEMKYLDMVIKETLRLYPPATITNRVCTKNHKFPSPMDGYSDYEVKKGVVIIFSIMGFHRDPSYFPDPEKFVPERFSDENKGTINPYTYMPFGSGPRKCIGDRFALMETKIVIANILKNFVIKFTDETQYPPKFKKVGFVLGIDGGLPIKFEARKKTN